MTKEKRHSYIVVSFLLVALMVGTAVYLGMQSQVRKTEDLLNGTLVRIKGTAMCLPHKDTSGPQTMECGIGIKDENGKYYALNDSDSNYRHMTDLPMNEKVTVEGKFDKVTNSQYPIIGTIRVAKIER